MKNTLLLCMALALGLQCSKDDPPPPPDPCESIQCLNGGSCDGGACICGPWHEGADCNQEVRAKFFGNYTGTLITKNGSAVTSGLATVIFATSATGVEYIRVDNNWNIKLTAASGVFAIPTSQTISGVFVTRGYGAFAGNQVVLTFGGGSQDITFYGQK